MWSKIVTSLAVAVIFNASILAEDKVVEKKPEPEKKAEIIENTASEKKVENEKKDEVLKVNTVEIATLERFKPLPPRSQEKLAPVESMSENNENLKLLDRNNKIASVVNLFLNSPKEARVWLKNKNNLKDLPNIAEEVLKLNKYLDSIELETKPKKENSEEAKTKIDKNFAKLDKFEIKKIIENIVK